MARTYHHDRKRYHPWQNPQARDRILQRYIAVWERQQAVRGSWLRCWRTGFHYIDYSTAGPSWFRNVHMERPARRQAKLNEIELRKRFEPRFVDVVEVPCHYGPECCSYMFVEEGIEDRLRPWPLPRKPTLYYW